jgi:fibro-slime domain-containing protein
MKLGFARSISPLLPVCLATFLACSAGTGARGGSGAASGTGDGDGDGDGDIGGDGDGDLVIGPSTGGSSSDKPPAVIETTLPAGFVANTAAPQPWECSGLPGGQCYQPAGGFLRVGSIADVPLEEANSCRNVLRGIVRDFEHSHPDFGGDANGDGIDAGLVQGTLSESRKPLPTGSTAIANHIEDWFTNGGGGNVPYVVDFWLQPVGEMFIFDSSRFFPLEGVGTLSGQDNDQVQRNFGFTTELHTAFEYKGGEIFTFTGDDDVWVFINNQLAVDLGGVHSQFSQSVNIDAFAASAGMTLGEVYNLDLFHAERNPTGSNFRIETSLDFKECGVLESDIVVR